MNDLETHQNEDGSSCVNRGCPSRLIQQDVLISEVLLQLEGIAFHPNFESLAPSLDSHPRTMRSTSERSVVDHSPRCAVVTSGSSRNLSSVTGSLLHQGARKPFQMMTTRQVADAAWLALTAALSVGGIGLCLIDALEPTMHFGPT